MPRIIVTTEPAAGANLATRIARVLDDAKVPNLLWGWQAIALVGCNEGIPDINFVIPDKYIDHAQKAIMATGSIPCKDPDCMELQVDYLAQGQQGPGPSRPPSRAQFHLPGSYHFHTNSASVITFYRKSMVCPWLPDFKAGLPAANDSNFWTTTDTRLAPRGDLGPSGPWDGLYAVRIMNYTNTRKAVQFLQDRDAGLPVCILWDWMKHSLRL